jgi:hypothetical protein
MMTPLSVRSFFEIHTMLPQENRTLSYLFLYHMEMIFVMRAKLLLSNAFSKLFYLQNSVYICFSEFTGAKENDIIQIF